MKSTILFPAALIVAASALTGCFLTGNSSGGEASLAEKVQVGPYKVVGDRIITTSLLDTSYYCVGDSLEVETDNSRPDTVRFLISGNKLTLFTHIDTMPSGALVQMTSISTRVGSGSGLDGAWRFSDQGFELVSGTMTAKEKANLERMLSESKSYSTFMTITVEFAGGSISTYIDGNTAAQFVDQWNKEDVWTYLDSTHVDPADSAKYDMTLKALDQYTVELKGRITGETVRIKLTPKGNRTYTSDSTGHAEHHFLVDPKTCPNDYQPEWFRAFQSGNMKPGQNPLFKSSEIRGKIGFSPKSHRFPLKAVYSFLN